VALWPENWPAWLLFSEMRGQWRTAPMGGALALDYTPLFLRMQRLGLTDPEWEELYQDVRALEAAALEQMKKNG